jgi:hypothetical protein
MPAASALGGVAGMVHRNRTATTSQRLDGRSGRELGRQPSERARYGHSRRVDGAHPEVSGDFGQTPVRFEARQNDLAISRAESLQRIAISLIGLRLDRRLEWRRTGRCGVVRQLDPLRSSGDPTHFVPDSIVDRLAQICLKRADVARFEHVQPAQYVECRVLHKIAGVEVSARRGG